MIIIFLLNTFLIVCYVEILYTLGTCLRRTVDGFFWPALARKNTVSSLVRKQQIAC